MQPIFITSPRAMSRNESYQTDTIHLLRQSALDFLQVLHSQNYGKLTPRMTVTQVHHPVMKFIKIYNIKNQLEYFL